MQTVLSQRIFCTAEHVSGRRSEWCCKTPHRLTWDRAKYSTQQDSLIPSFFFSVVVYILYILSSLDFNFINYKHWRKSHRKANKLISKYRLLKIMFYSIPRIWVLVLIILFRMRTLVVKRACQRCCWNAAASQRVANRKAMPAPLNGTKVLTAATQSFRWMQMVLMIMSANRHRVRNRSTRALRRGYQTIAGPNVIILIRISNLWTMWMESWRIAI